ncbi:T9SS type A sorting domain-containing protein [Adhaeribacter pallidiroseus]|uniref:Secretion system C-terminal sorting domain-containing protein n=1 Tax=Adhaeribacter pallidiroseus TaxID=2072847 RepID=A0A369QNN5_9BACT|nr:T9SS type A sorting domain-containing protein [Adhaeribacter pallidiroseus]RDC64876.1 hypothetical protein AHMF7616_03498 [Adhaeribacter pallidiroseus]
MKTKFTSPVRCLAKRTWRASWPQLASCLILLLGFRYSTLQAQTKQWDKTLGGSKNDQLSISQPTLDGGYILGGTSESNQSGDKSQNSKGSQDYWIVKLDATGNKQWNKTFGGTDYDQLGALQQTADGGYILGGSSRSNKSGDKSANRKGGTDYWIIKLDASGTKLWDKTLGGSSGEGLTALQQTADGGYILGGYSLSSAGQDKSENNRGGIDSDFIDYWIIKLDGSGTKQWDKTFGGTYDDGLTSLQQTPDGGYLLGGQSASNKSIDKSEDSRNPNNIFSYDGWVIKINGQGQKEWDKTLGGTSDEAITTLETTSDGGYMLGGWSASGINFDKSGANKGQSDYWLIKLTATGQKVWDKTLGGNDTDTMTSLEQVSDGSYILGGSSYSNTGGDKSEDSKGEGDYWVVKVDAKGSKIWDKTIGSAGKDELRSIRQTKDGNYILGGTSGANKSGDKSEISKGLDDYWVVKLTAANIQSQTITFEAIPNKTIFDKTFALKATSSSGLPVSFRVVSGPATVQGNLVTITSTGTVTIEASQPGNATYKPASKVTQTFVVEAPITKQWDKTLGGSEADFLYAMVPTADGGYLLGGSSSSPQSGDKSQPSQGGSDYWIVKVDNTGKKRWDKTFGGNGNDQMQAIVATPDGGYLLGGTSASGKSEDKSQESKGKEDFWLVKIDGNGQKLWDKTYGSDSTDALISLITTTDGGFLLGGYTIGGKSEDKSQPSRDTSTDPNDSYYRGDYWVIKINSQGQKIWDKTLGGSKGDRIGSIAVTTGGYIVSGGSNSTISGDRTVSNSYDGEPNAGFLANDIWLVKLGENGQVIWDKSLDAGSRYDHFSAEILATSDGNFVVSGETYYDHDTVLYTVFKVNKEGQPIWFKFFTSGTGSYRGAIIQTPDGGYLLGGELTKIDANGEIVYTYPLFAETLFNTPDGGYLLGNSSAANKTVVKSEDSRGSYDYWVVKIKEDSPNALAWNLRYGGTGNEGLLAVQKTADGGYLAAGYTNSGVSGDKTQPSRGKNDYWLVKTNAAGQKQWDKRFGGSDHDYLNRVIQTPDGSFLLAGSSFSGQGGDKSQPSRGGRDYWIIKISSAGVKLWDMRFGGSGDDELKKVVQLATGEYILAGYSNSPADGDKSQGSRGGTDYWLVKVSSTGTKIWDKRYGGSLNDELSGLVETANGGFLLAGSSLSGKGGEKSQVSRGGQDFWLVQTDRNGNKLWDQTYGGSGEDEAYALSRAGNMYWVAGQSNSPQSGEQTQASFGGTDFWLLQVSSTGAKMWDKRYGGNQDEELRAGIVTQDGGYLLAGRSYSGRSGTKTQASQGVSDYWIVKVDPQGTYQWDQAFGGSDVEELRAVTQATDGNYVLAGRSYSGVSGDRTQPSQGGSDYWLVKVNAPQTSSLVATRVSNLVPEEVAVKTEALNLQAYPNPFQEKVTVSFAVETTQPVSLQAYDSQGRKVATLFQGQAQAKQPYEVEWQAKNQATGLYFLRLQTAGKVQHQKVLLTR